MPVNPVIGASPVIVTTTTGGGGGGVEQLLAGTNITLTPTTGKGIVTIATTTSNVEQLLAGTNITLTPTTGKGIVTIAASGGGGGSPIFHISKKAVIGAGAQLTIPNGTQTVILPLGVITSNPTGLTIEITSTGVVSGSLGFYFVQFHIELTGLSPGGSFTLLYGQTSGSGVVPGYASVSHITTTMWFPWSGMFNPTTVSFTGIFACNFDGVSARKFRVAGMGVAELTIVNA